MSDDKQWVERVCESDGVTTYKIRMRADTEHEADWELHEPNDVHDDWEIAIRGFIKWDGCMQGYGAAEPCFHFDDMSNVDEFAAALKEIRKLAAEVLPAWNRIVAEGEQDGVEREDRYRRALEKLVDNGFLNPMATEAYADHVLAGGDPDAPDSLWIRRK